MYSVDHLFGTVEPEGYARMLFGLNLFLRDISLKLIFMLRSYL
jgi:hypothetical protein